MSSFTDYQVLIQDVALELARLDRRLGKMSVSAAVDLAVRIEGPRRSLQELTLQLLELAQASGKERLREEGEAFP